MVQQGEDANRSRRPEEDVTVTQRMEEAQANAQAPSLVPRLVGGAIGREGNMEGGGVEEEKQAWVRGLPIPVLQRPLLGPSFGLVPEQS